MFTLPALGARLLVLTFATVQQAAPGGSQQPFTPRSVDRDCSFIGASHNMSFTPGMSVENTFVTSADPETRRYIVHVPSSYQADQGPYPVVYMLHGTGQNAGTPITKLTWDELAETRSFIAVFPEALEYDLQDGTTRTKWHTNAVADEVVEPYELPLADDVLFLRELHNTLGAHLSIDCERVYASGFSNGGAFVKTKIRVELADIFAATSSAGGVGVRTTSPGEFFPLNVLEFRPHFEIVGNRDANRKGRCVDEGDLLPGEHLPMAAADIMATPCMWDHLISMADEMGMYSALFTSIEQANRTQFRWSSEALPSFHPREYRFVILRDLTHEYPSGTNYPVDYVPIYHDWMMQHTR